MILTRSTRLSQPQGPVELDYTSPLVRGVVVAWVPGASKNLVGGRPASVGGVVKPGGIGLVRATTGTQSAFTAPDAIDQRTANFTSFAILRRVEALPSYFDGVGKNWQSNSGSTFVSDTVAYNATTGTAQNSIRAVFGRAGGNTTTAAYSGQETTEWHSIASTHNGSTGSLYVSGVLRASVAVQPVVYGASGDNSFGVNTSGKSGGMEYALVLRWNRALSAGEIASIEANPWQLFRPVQRRVYFDMGAGGGGGTTHTVTADPVEQGSTTTRPGLTQTHVTTARAVAQGATVSRPAVTQTHVVTARAVAQGSTVNAPTVEVGSITVVTARPVVQSSTVNAPSIVQTHIVTARPAVHGGTVTRPGQAQGHQAGSTRPGFEMSSRKVYVKRGKRIHIFDTAEDADEWLEAEDKARQVVNVAKPKSQAKARVFKALDEAVPHDVVRLDVVRSMVDYLGIPVEMPTLEARQDWAEVARVALMARHMQDEEDIELLLVA